MMRNTPRRIVLLVLCVRAGLPAAGAAAATLTLHEPLDRDWPAQWVSLTAELPAGQFASHELWLVEEQGRDVDHAFEIESTHPDGSARKVTCWVHTGLDAGQTRRFSIEKRGSELAPAFITAIPVEAGVQAQRITLASDLIEVTTWQADADGRAPLQARQPGASAVTVRRTGGDARLEARLVSLPEVESLTVTQDRSPGHRLTHELRYALAGGGCYVLRLTLIAHEPVLLIDEDFRDVAYGALQWEVDRTWRPTMVQGRGRLSPPCEGRLTEGCRMDFSREWTGRVQPFYAWWHDYGLWWAAFRPGGDYIGVLPLAPPAWSNPPPNAIQIRTGPPHTVRLVCPLQKGTRRWAMVMAAAEDALAGSEGGANLMMRQAIRLGQNPLDKINRMILTWPGMDQIENPRLLCGPGDLPRIREKASTHPAYRRVLEHHAHKPNDPAGLYLATGDERHADQAARHVVAQLNGWIEAAVDGTGYGEDLCAIGFTRPLRRAALIYDAVASSASMTATQRHWCLRAFAFLAYCLADENRWPARYQGFARGNVNFHSDDYTCRAAVACLLQGHPMQREWMDFVEREMRYEFESSVYPGGAWCEAPNYQGFTMHYLMIAMRIMQLNGFADFATEPRFRATMDYFFRILTPRDVRAGQRLLPTVGDTTSYYHSQSLANVFAWAARLFADDAPELAGRMMHAWKECGSVVFGAHGLDHGAGWIQPLLMLDPDIPAVRPHQPLQSERLPGYGAVLRNNYGTDRESYFLFKMGQADQHYDADEGSFHWYALGMPISLDFGSMYNPSIEQPWLHSTLDFDRQCTWTRGEVTDFISLPALDLCTGRVAVNDLQRVPDLPGQPLPAGVSGVIRRAEEFIAWQRAILFVKGPDYVVIRDDLDDARDSIPTGWSLQVLASAAELSGPRAKFTGQHGVDLAVLFAQPADPHLSTSQWGHDGREAPDWVSSSPMPAMGETQIALHAGAPPDGDYLAALVPHRHEGEAPELQAVSPAAIRIRHDEGNDLVLFGTDAQVLRAQDVTFAGRVGMVRRTADGCALHIIDGLSMLVPEMIAQFPGPVSLDICSGRIRGVCDGVTRTCFLHWLKDVPPLPARLTIDGEAHYAYSTFDGYLSFSVPAGRHVFEVRYDPQP